MIAKASKVYLLPTICILMVLVFAIDCAVLREAAAFTAGNPHLSSWYRSITPAGKGPPPSWERHIEALSLCNRRPLSELTEGGWYITEEGHYLYEPNSCHLRRIPGEVGRRCLQGKHVVFIGDSLTRYQYLEFAYFLSKLHKTEPYGNISGLPSISIETEWKDWEHFYQLTTAILGAAAEGCGTEICDCQRNTEDKGLTATREYRTLHLTFPYGCHVRHSAGSSSKPMGQLTLSYQQIFAQPDPLTAARDSMKYYEQSYRQQPPDIVIFNMGHHIAHLQAGDDFNSTFTAIIQSGEALVRVHHTNMLWKTTTPPRDTGAYVHQREESELVKAFNYPVYDIARISSAGAEQGLNLYWDNMHFLPFVYQQFNDVLFTYLCS